MTEGLDILRMLLEKRADNVITAEETDQLHELLQAYWDNLAAGRVAGHINWDAMFLQIMSTPSIPIKKLAKRAWWSYAAAAAILFVIAGTYFLFNQRNEKSFSKTGQSQNRNDVPPGGNRAVLTLANGSKVQLDSLNIGTLSQQGNAIIQKLDSGKLEYAALKGDAASVMYNTLTTPRGGQYQLQLSDGTKVWLNAASSIIYPVSFTEKIRRIRLTGEAYFEVAKDATHPFEVTINDQSVVRVLGTHFNVMAYPDERMMAATLLEGSVSVQPDSNAKAVIIKPGQQALLEAGSMLVKMDVDTASVVSWKNGVISFTDADIPSIMRKIGRWYDVEVSYTGHMSEKRLAGGITRSANLSEVLKILSLYEVHYKLEGRKLIILP